MSASEHLSPQQFAAIAKVRALPDHGAEYDNPGVVYGSHVTSLMAEHNITQHPFDPHDHEIYSHGWEGTATHHPEDMLHTSQEHLYKPALEKYIREGHEHLTDPDHDYDGVTRNVPYHPEITAVGERHWIEEGHHRIIASRMLGKSIEAHHGSSLHDDSYIDYDKD